MWNGDRGHHCFLSINYAYKLCINHLVCLLFRSIFCLFTVLLVYFSETINELAAIHWRSFSRQQYFDSSGLFISTVFSIPILLNCMLMIVSIVFSY